MTNKERKKEKIEQIKWQKKKIIIIVCVIIIASAILYVTVFALNNAKIAQFTKVIPKETVRGEIVQTKVEIANPKVLSSPLWVADNLAVEDLMKDGNKVGEEGIVVIDNPDTSKSAKIPKEASLLLIIDNNLKIIGFKPFSPSFFTLGIDFNTFFDDFKGKDTLQFINRVDGIYTDNSDTALMIKNKVKEAMILFYIEKYGIGAYNALANNEFVFADKGAKITPIKAKDINGNEINLEDYRNYKIFVIGGNPDCGGCVEDIKKIGLEIAKYDSSNVKFIVLSFSQYPDDAQKFLSSLPAGTIAITDPDMKIATELKVESSPYIALIDKGLTLFYSGPGEPTKETTTQIQSFFQGS